MVRINHPKIRARRRELGLTQQALAMRADLNMNTVYALDRGYPPVDFRVETLDKVATALELTVTDLIIGAVA